MTHEGEQSLQRRPDLIPEEILRGGLVEGAVGEPERSMDGMIGRHLDRIALLSARGDTAPERPIYIFNPDSKLLIKYALRRDENPARSGLFADVVELDKDGKPRYGVSTGNPFQSKAGFVEVSVGDNPHGFTPSHIDLKLDSDDPLSMVPPNIHTAELISMLNTEPILNDETLEEFLKRTEARRAELRQQAVLQQTERYTGTTQGLASSTNPYLHLIISDRDMTSVDRASRELGLFPIVLSMEELLETHAFLSKLFASNDAKSHMYSFTRGWLGEQMPTRQQSYTPGIITFDYTSKWGSIDATNPLEHGIEGNRVVETIGIINKLTHHNPVFAQVRNEAYHPDWSKDGVRKILNGMYKHVIDPQDADNMKNYTDWLRKAQLDMALTFYLRGLSQL